MSHNTWWSFSRNTYEWFSKYFADDDVGKFAWIQDPFHTQALTGFSRSDLVEF
ncbi:unnamed protein product, partial [Callosobruchus maculatus]